MINIARNKEIEAAMKSIIQSLYDQIDYLSEMLEYLERPVTHGIEKRIASINKKYGIPFNSLSYDERILTENPYFKNISLENIDSPSVSYLKNTIPERTLMNMGFNRPLGKYLFNYHTVGYFPRDIEMPSLREGSTTWMSPAPSEIISMDEGIRKGTGKCLTMGLGIGFLPYMWLQKDDVESVTIIENNKDVIDLFDRVIRPQFKTGKRLDIIHGDAFEYYNEDFLGRFDYVYIDFWESNDDGLKDYIRLMEKRVDLPHVDYWIEGSILFLVEQTVALYLFTLYQKEDLSAFISSSDYETRLISRKANKYFKTRNDTISTEEELLALIHDRKVLRELLSIKVSV